MVGVTIITIGRPWGRSVGVYVVATVASGLAFWLATGQHLADLGAYASGVFEVIAGYNAAMGGDPAETRRWLYLALPGVAGLLIRTAWLSSRAWPRRRRIGLAMLAVVFGFAMWKLAVVREHVTFVFATALVAMFPFATHVDRRTWLASALAIGIAFAGSSAMQPTTYLDVVGSTRSIVNEVRHSLPGLRNGRPSGHRPVSSAGMTSIRRRSRRSGPRPSISIQSWPRPRMHIRILPGDHSRPSSRTPPTRRP